MRDWLTVIGVLLIVGILLDGLRRMRNAKRDSIRMSPNMKRRQIDDEPFEDIYGSELPNGGARVVTSSINNLANDVESAISEGYDAANQRESVAANRMQRSEPQQVALNLDDSVPMLMESVHDDAADTFDSNRENNTNERVEPKFNLPLTQEETHSQNREPQLESRNTSEPEEVIIINIMMKERTPFQGDELLDVLLQTGMRFGDMNIFHRHEGANGEGEILFSLANMVKPGYFELDAMETFQTPGVTLFMTLPLKAESLKTFDTMKATAQAICTALDGDLKDQDRNLMTHQSMEHCRQRIQDYERKRLSRSVI